MKGTATKLAAVSRTTTPSGRNIAFDIPTMTIMVSADGRRRRRIGWQGTGASTSGQRVRQQRDKILGENAAIPVSGPQVVAAADFNTIIALVRLHALMS